jgi:hypothetical protein
MMERLPSGIGQMFRQLSRAVKSEGIVAIDVI